MDLRCGQPSDPFTSANHSSENATYFYDNSSQLIGADRSGTAGDESYTYDDNGNRVTADGASYSTGANNRLLSEGTYNYTYDDEGNRSTRTRISSATASDHRTEYTWDHRNRLTKVVFKNNSGVITKEADYAYDIFDRRIAKTVDWAKHLRAGKKELVNYSSLRRHQSFF